MSMAPTGSGEPGNDSYDLHLAIAQLSANSGDLRIMLRALVDQLGDTLGDRLHVERAGRFRKSDEIRSVQVTLGDDTLEARLDGAALRCTVGHRAGGIRIRSEQTDMAGWLTKLLGALQAEAAHSEQARHALEQLMIGGPS